MRKTTKKTSGSHVCRRIRMLTSFICLAALVCSALLGDVPVAYSVERGTICGEQEHIHDDQCWKQQLNCGDENHEHDETCYTERLICGFDTEHTHSADCYAESLDSVEETIMPTAAPTADPSEAPALEPTAEATVISSDEPTQEPTPASTEAPEPSAEVTEAPIEVSTIEPGSEPEEMIAAITSEQRYAFAGKDALVFDTSVCGGAEPMTVEYTICVNGNAVYTHSGYEAQISYMPEVFGAHMLTMTATDANGQQASAEYSIPVAVEEREYPSDWEKTFSGIKLTGNFAEDILAIAETQLGYAESGRNFIVDEAGTQHGYTRYGDWYGADYSEWCTMFVSFCAHYAQIPESVLPKSENCGLLVRSSLYRAMESGYSPEAGDLVFFYYNGSEENGERNVPKHTGIVSESDGNILYTIEGTDGVVHRGQYALGDSAIAGYVSMADIAVMHTPPATEAPEPIVEPTETPQPEIADISVRVEPDAFRLGEAVTITAQTNAEALFQWQRSLDGENWENVEGANAVSLMLTADEENTRYYYRVLKLAWAEFSMVASMSESDDVENGLTAEGSMVVGMGQTVSPLNVSLYEAVRSASDTPNPAPDYIGAINTANVWQIVDGQYQGNAQSNKLGYDGNGDGMNDLFLQKNVIPTGVENEFRVYLSMDRQMTWDGLLAESTLGLTTQGKWKESDVGRLVNQTEIGGNKSNQLQPGQGSRNYLATIYLQRGGKTVHTYTGWYNGTTPNASNCTGYILLKGLSGKAIIASISVNLHNDGGGSGGSLSYTIDLDQMAKNNIYYLVEPLNFDTVIDTMGDNMIFGTVENADGTYAYDEAARTLTWNPVPNENVEGSNQQNPVTGYHFNVCQLVYTVKLDVTQVGFNACAGNMNSAVGDAESYKVNNRAVLEYHFGENGVHKQQEYPVPYVRGLLYDVALTKVGVTDGQSDEHPLPGAEFSLYEADGITPVQRDGASYTVVSAIDGTVHFTDLAWGSYVVRETGIPDGYEQRGDSAWNVRLCYTTDRSNLSRDSAPYDANMRYTGYDSGGTWKVVNVKKPLFNLTLVKQSNQDAEMLAGAQFELTLPDGTTRLLTTGADGVATFNGLEMDTEYVLTEKTPPEGHFPWTDSTQVRFKIGKLESGYGITEWTADGFSAEQADFAAVRFAADALQLTMTAKDERAHSLQLKKSDRTDHMKSLSGAVFALFSDEACTMRQPYYASPVLTADGATTADIVMGAEGVMIYGLRKGTYYLKELAAPAGYCLISDAMKIVVDVSGNISSDVSTDQLETTNTEGSHTATVYDVPIRQLPATGGWGTGCFYAVGLILMLFAAFFYKGKCTATRAERR